MLLAFVPVVTPTMTVPRLMPTPLATCPSGATPTPTNEPPTRNPKPPTSFFSALGGAAVASAVASSYVGGGIWSVEVISRVEVGISYVWQKSAWKVRMVWSLRMVLQERVSSGWWIVY